VNRTSKWVSSGRPASVSAISSEIGSIKDANDFKIRFYMGSKAHRDFRYILVDTDYENYALVYSCIDGEPLEHETAWILSRKRDLDYSIIDELKEKLKIKNVDISKFVKINQNSCF
jgi:lipocalin